ncbi:hypothetical protein PPUJ13061_08920 [Pseudomonas putida]|nr:hypothetical protein PPUJ13061_08920 [Pseudomonas putida]
MAEQEKPFGHQTPVEALLNGCVLISLHCNEIDTCPFVRGLPLALQLADNHPGSGETIDRVEKAVIEAIEQRITRVQGGQWGTGHSGKVGAHSK